MPRDLEPLTVPVFARVADYAGVWAIEPRAGAALWSLARGMDLRQHVAENRDRPPERKSEIEMQPAGNGKHVAVIRVEGTLMKRASSLGGGGTVQMRRDIRKAANDQDVAAILLAIDSPGGTVAGTDDLAAEVRAAARKKTVWAFVSDLCASAAYWVASQADAIYANSDTALVGSIGTLMTVYDLSKAADAQGVEALVFATGPLKGAGTEGAPVSEEQRAYFQGLVDDSQKAFDAAVKKGRSMSDKQLAAARTGGVFGAAEAAGRGLIDGVQTYEATLAALIRESSQRNRAGRAAADPASPRGAQMDENETGAAATLPTVEQMRAEAAAELRRQAAIRAACKGHPEIAAKAIEEGWTVEKAELTALRADLPKPGPAANPHAAGPAIHTGPSGSQADADVVEAALCLSLGMQERFVAGQVRADARERVMNQATSGEYRGYTLHSLMGEVIRAAGHHYHGSHKSDDFIRAAKRADLALRASGSGFSTLSLSGILGNVANKGLIEAYTAVKTVWQLIAAVRNHSDFKTVTRYRLDSTGAFKKVGPDGELKHASLSEASYTNRLDTYGVMLALNRQQMINDDLGAFLDLPKLMGRMGALRIEEAVFVLLLSNPASFFSAGNRNLLTGAGSALSLSALTTAEATFANQVDSNGKPVLVDPAVLLVPTVLKVTAESIFKNDKIVSTTTADKPLTDDNPHVGKFRPVASPYLNNTNLKDQDGLAISGQSATAWYLLAEPAVRAAVAVAFLNGQQTPTIESSETDFNTLGIQWRAYQDFGVGMEDPNAAQKNAGA